MTNMRMTYDILVDRLADLEQENRELRALILEQDKEWEEQRLEIERLNAVIDDDNRIC